MVGDEAEETGQVGHKGSRDLDFYPDSHGCRGGPCWHLDGGKVTLAQRGGDLGGVKAGQEAGAVVQVTGPRGRQ